MLEHLIRKAAARRGPFKPRVLVCVPAGVTSVERRAVLQAAEAAGAGEAATIEETMAAAIGAGLPISLPGGNMVVDIGGGTTDIAVISLGGLVVSKSLRVGGNKLDEVIVRHIRNAYNLLIGDRTAEEIKIKIGSAFPLDIEEEMEVKGRDLITGIPKSIKLSSVEVREALKEPIDAMVEALKQTLERTPPELAADIVDRGIVLTGGGALLRGLDKLLKEATNLNILIAEDPLLCVVLGAGRIHERFEEYESVLLKSSS
jgi:rod shape-determining protein MreB